MISKLKLFFKWGIKFGEKYEVEDNGNRPVKYSDKNELLKSILKRYPIIKKESNDEDYNNFPQAHGVSPRNKRAPRNEWICKAKRPLLQIFNLGFDYCKVTSLHI